MNRILLQLLYLLIIISTVSAQSDIANIFIEPRYPDGYAKLKAYVSKYVSYPYDAINNGTQGICLVTINIDKYGNVGNIDVDGPRKNYFGGEIKRALSLMPIWEPAVLNGERIDTTVDLNIYFSIDYSAKAKNDTLSVEILEYRVPIYGSMMDMIEEVQRHNSIIEKEIEKGNYNEALELMIQLETNKYRSWTFICYNRGIANYKLNNIKLACSDWFEGYRLGAEKSEVKFNEHCICYTELDKGMNYYKFNDYENALNNFNNAYSFNPIDTNILYYRAITKLKLTDKIGAIEDLNDAIDLGSNYSKELLIKNFPNQILVGIYYKIAMKYFDENQYDKSIKYLNKIIDVFPDYSAAYIKRAKVKYMNGDNEGACIDWNYALEMGIEEVKDNIDQYCK